MELGDMIVMGIDMNENVRTGKLVKRLQALGLRELILSTHSAASPPDTFVRNTLQTPIEGIWGTETVEVFRAGYLPFNAGPPAASSDAHRLIWAEVCNRSILWKQIPHSTKAIQAKGLKAKDPRCKRSYSRIVRKKYNRQSIFATKKKGSNWI